MRLIDADATLEQMKGMNMLFSPKIVIDNMPTVDTKQIRADAIDEFASVMNDLIVSCGCYVSTAEVKKLAEQLKEQKCQK